MLICVESRDDPALEVARMVSRQFPFVRCRFFTEASEIGLNPKINNICTPGCPATCCLVMTPFQPCDEASRHGVTRAESEHSD